MNYATETEIKDASENKCVSNEGCICENQIWSWEVKLKQRTQQRNKISKPIKYMYPQKAGIW